MRAVNLTALISLYILCVDRTIYYAILTISITKHTSDSEVYIGAVQTAIQKRHLRDAGSETYFRPESLRLRFDSTT